MVTEIGAFASTLTTPWFPSINSLYVPGGSMMVVLTAESVKFTTTMLNAWASDREKTSKPAFV